MGGEEGWNLAPNNAPFDLQKDDHLRHFDSNSVNAVSFGFLATAILISMFLIMAIFERFIRPASPDLTPSGGRRHAHDIESQSGFPGKVCYPSPKVSLHARELSVLMPGENQPTFIAYPAPVPCPPIRVTWPPNSHYAPRNHIYRTSPIASSSSLRRQQASEIG